VAGKPNDEKAPIIFVKRVKKTGGAHHGGAWKVAYADFVTAMMSFFLLLWLLNVTTDEQKMLISSYFAPADPRIATSTSGAGGVLGGTTMSPTGAMTSVKSPVTAMQEDPAAGVGRQEGEDGEHQNATTEDQQAEDTGKTEENAGMKIKTDQQGQNAAAKAADKASDAADNKAFEAAEDKIKQAIEQTPELKELAQHLLVDMTPEGLRIQIIDQEGKPMFEVGSAKPLPSAEKLFQLITNIVKDMPNKISIRGHTDGRPYGPGAAYTNWELSADRANASRRVMLGDGLDVTRVENVQGKADRELLVANDPQSARNRRISIILLKQSIAPAVKKPPPPKPVIPVYHPPAGPDTKKREEGVIYFP
jgi:chemotaxis protein MotB